MVRSFISFCQRSKNRLQFGQVKSPGEETTAEAKTGMGTPTGKLNAPVTTGTGAVINGEVVSAGDADAEMDQVAVKGTGQPVSKPAEGSAGVTTTSGSAAATGGATGAGVISDEPTIPLNSVKSEISEVQLRVQLKLLRMKPVL